MPKPRVVGMIPSRLQSSRLPRKALADIRGMPMVEHVYRRCLLAKSLDESVLVPKDCAGRRVVVQGVVTALPAEHKAEPQPTDGHACPRPEYVIATQGIELK